MPGILWFAIFGAAVQNIRTYNYATPVNWYRLIIIGSLQLYIWQCNVQCCRLGVSMLSLAL